MNTTLCDQCGAWVTPDIDKCPKCGYQLIECCQGQPPADPSDDKNEDPQIKDNQNDTPGN